MKKQILLIWITFVVVLFGVGAITAQDKNIKDGKMDMAAMKKSPHHTVMMTHQQNALSFARVLRDMTTNGKFEDVAMARNAFSEIKHCMDQMEEIHQSHMASMSSEMRAKMEPMMANMKPKMDADKAAVKEHMDALDKALQKDAPDAVLVHKHAAELVLQLEKMGAPDKKMDMPGKKPM